VGRFFGEITGDMVRRGGSRPVGELKKAVMGYIEESSEDPKPFKWAASADRGSDKIGAFCKGLCRHHTSWLNPPYNIAGKL